MGEKNERNKVCELMVHPVYVNGKLSNTSNHNFEEMKSFFEGELLSYKELYFERSK